MVDRRFGLLALCILLLSSEGSGGFAKASAGSGVTAKKVAKRAKKNQAVRGSIEVALIWDGMNDLDLAVVPPGGSRIDANHRYGVGGGSMDLDYNFTPLNEVGQLKYEAGEPVSDDDIIPYDEVRPGRGGRFSSEPIEHIYWPTEGAPDGHYRIYVSQFYNREESTSTPFQVQVTINGKVVKTFQGVCGAADIVRNLASDKLAGSFNYPVISRG